MAGTYRGYDGPVPAVERHARASLPLHGLRAELRARAASKATSPRRKCWKRSARHVARGSDARRHVLAEPTRAGDRGNAGRAWPDAISALRSPAARRRTPAWRSAESRRRRRRARRSRGSAGITSRRWPPGCMPCTPSSQPRITWPAPIVNAKRLAAIARAVELRALLLRRGRIVEPAGVVHDRDLALRDALARALHDVGLLQLGGRRDRCGGRRRLAAPLLLAARSRRAEPSRTSQGTVTLFIVRSSTGPLARTAKITSMHREQQPVESLHERCRLGQLSAVRERRLLEQQHRQVVERRVLARSPRSAAAADA